MQKIVPHLWFDKEAVSAAEFYTSIFPDSKITHKSVIKDTPSGDCDIVSFSLSGFDFMAISAGPYFKINPSISFFLNFDPSKNKNARKNLDKIWEKLSKGGKVLMPLQKYPFSEHYGWIQDKFGVSWQLILTNPEGDEKPFIVPSIMFTQEVNGKAREASDYYMKVFGKSKRGILAEYPKEMPDRHGELMYTDFMIEGQWFAAMDGGQVHGFKFNEAISLIVNCKDQKEIDYFWGKLSHVKESEQCGWCKDKFGVSWQIVPREMNEMMSRGTAEQKKRVTESFLKMKKFDIAKLKKAFDGKQ